MSQSVLIVDPAADWAAEAAAHLRSLGRAVEIAGSGKQALQYIAKMKDAVSVVNLQLPDVPGIQILQVVRQKFPDARLIPTAETDEASVQAEGDLTALGLGKALAKPVDFVTLGKLVKGVSEETKVSAPGADFAAIRIDEFFTGKTSLFDVFLRLGAGNYLRIFSVGDAYQEDKLAQYSEDKGMKFLYLALKDRPKYVTYSQKLLQRVTGVPGVATRTKLAIARNLVEKHMQVLHAEGPEEELLEEGKVICSTVAALIMKEAGLKDALFAFDQYDSSLFSHGFLAGMFAAYLSRQFDWTSAQITEQVLQAATLMDLGLAGLPLELSKLKMARMNGAQRTEYKKHPVLSNHLVRDSKALSQAVKQIILQHHEYADGSGFPNGLPSDKTLLLSKAMSLAGEFARYTADSLLPPIDAAKAMFPDRSKNAFVNPPELFAKFDRAILESFFLLIDGPPKPGARA